MTEYIQDLLNVVVIGNMNPQIINHEWLLKEKIINEKYFVSSQPGESPFKQYISTPLLTQIIYDNIKFTVEMQRFELSTQQKNINSDIFNITKEYFSKLIHTPVTRLGFNIIGFIKFKSVEELEKFNKKWLNYSDSLVNLVGNKEISLGFGFTFKEDNALYRLDCMAPDAQYRRQARFNCEFNIKATTDIINILSDSLKYINRMDTLIKGLIKI
jgi:hypothetical protein